jgi:hypothetical protein
MVFSFLWLAGAGLMISSIAFRTAGAPPIASLNPRHWVPLWKTKRWYKPPGYILAQAGLSIMGIASVVLIYYWLR